MAYQVNTGDIARPVVLVDPTTGEAVGGTAATAQAVQGNVASGATDSGNPVKIAGKYNVTLPTFTDGQRGEFQINAKGAFLLAAEIGLGTDAQSATLVGAMDRLGAVRVFGVAGFVFNGATWDRLKKPSSNARLISSVATTNATSAKASAGDVFSIKCSNTAATKRYLKLYNKATAPTVGTDTPFATYVLPASSQFEISFPAPLYFSTGIAYAITDGSSDANTQVIAAGDIECLNIAYA